MTFQIWPSGSTSVQRVPSAGGPTNTGQGDPVKSPSEMTFQAASTLAEPDGSKSVVRLSGDLDILTAEDLKRRLVKLIKGGSAKVVLDLEAVDFVDSSGLGALVALHKLAVSCGGRLVVRSAPSRVRQLFSLTRLDELLILET